MVLENRILAAQAFSSNLLNRSSLERRDAAFIEQALPQAQILLVSGKPLQKYLENSQSICSLDA